ncbi:MAG: tetratricopeptide repeat protein [Acidobacteriota bacterium]
MVLVAVFPAALIPQSTFRGSSENSTTAATAVRPGSLDSTAVAPQPQLSHQELGDVHMVWHRYRAALKEYEQAEPRTAAVWNGMGVAYQMLYATKNAIHCYKESARLDHKNVLPLNNLGTVYDSLGDLRQGESYYRKALKIDPHSATALKNLGTNLLLQRRYKEGQELYRQAIAMDPDQFEEDAGGHPATGSPASIHEIGAANYLKARSCARAGLTDCALQNLTRAVNEGVVTSKKMAAEHDFDPIRTTREFQRLLTVAQ